MNKKYLKIIFVAVFCLAVAAMFNQAALVLAVSGEQAVVELDNPLGTKTPDKTFILQKTGTIIKGFLGVTGSIALVMFVYGGMMWLISGGNPDKIKKGKDVLVWAVIGLAIIFSSYFLVDLVVRALTAKT
ncbi:MAG: hypothetical protein AAB673_01310 [Patescibacteria group bacterium]